MLKKEQNTLIFVKMNDKTKRTAIYCFFQRMFLLQEKKYPKSLLNVEKTLKINGLTKRYDIVIYQPNGSIFLLVECKSPQIKISQNTFNQIARYNLTLKAQFLMVTNGLNHYFCKMDFENEKYIFLNELPTF